ncbi:MAG TPA: peptidoglycan DD-metalloendopeptidase family protein [Nakamurella sp.]|nr:peptidoglycan DD-metalloendopeptidase family protein [Nakamurella sp.]
MRGAMLAVALMLLAAVPAAGAPTAVPRGAPRATPVTAVASAADHITVVASAADPVTAYPSAVGFVTARASPGVPVTAASFALPVPPPAVVLTPFRPPATRYGPGHRGVDLAAPAGTAIRAAGGGTVVYAGNLAGRGVVSVEHPGGLRTTYEPVQATVTAGQWVAAGSRIGTLQPGHPSCAPAECLHWGARLPDGSYLDPMSLLHPWRVRLKPWDGTG